MPIVLGMMPAKHPRTRTMSERLLSSLVENFVELNQELVWVGCEGCSNNDAPCLGGACVEQVHTWRVQMWRESTHGPGNKQVSTKNTTTPDHPNTRQDHRFHGHINSNMTGSSM